MEKSAHYGFNEEQLKISQCDYDGCDNQAEYYDHMDGKICGDCMERELQDDDTLTPEDFEEIS